MRSKNHIWKGIPRPILNLKVNDVVSSAKMKGEAKAGDMVTVKYREKDGKMMASSVTRGKARKRKKTTTTKTKTETTK
jgi:hypothetical protein